MSNTEKLDAGRVNELKEWLGRLTDAHSEILAIWSEYGDREIEFNGEMKTVDEILENGYPYQSCFMELFHEVIEWERNINNNIKVQ